MKSAIILFVRNPELGKVKTRLASEIGDAAALKVYIELLAHTHTNTCNLPCDKFVFYADSIGQADIWEDKIYFKQLQVGNDLGERMLNAFQHLFDKGYEKVVIIGSDCPGLTYQLIENAFDLLNAENVVIGPAVDGGYYLLGMSFMVEELFKNKKWSTNSVLTDSLNTLTQETIQYSLLPVLQDIDTKADIIQSNFKAPL